MKQNKNTSLQRFRSFDFLRGLAILGVIAVHTSQSFSSGNAFLNEAVSFGAKGVQLFFFISALTMCYMWKKREGEDNPIRKFYIRRFLRIAPLFWLAIPIYLLVNGLSASYWAPEGIGISIILLTVTFLHGFWPSSINSVVPGGWSIAIEMTFYVMFPLLISVIKDNRKVYLFAAAAVWFVNVLLFQDFVVGFFASHYSTSSTTIVRDFLYLNFINQAPIFLLGCYLFFILQNSPTRGELIFILGWVAFAWVMRRWINYAGFEFLVLYITLGIFVFTTIKCNLKFGPLELLGRNSYAIYLIHFLVLHYLQKILLIPTSPLSLVIGMVLTILISYLMSKATLLLIENRVQNFANKVTNAT